MGIVGLCGGAAMVLFRRPLARAQIAWQRKARFHWGGIPSQRWMERSFVLVGVFWIVGGVLALIGPFIWR